MGVVRLTEKKLRDARFKRTEEAIFEAFFDMRDGAKLNVNELIQRVGVDRTTFYRHHRAVYEIAEDYEQYIMEKYIKSVEMIRKRDGVELKIIYCRMMGFILQNRRVFEVLLGAGSSRVVEKMVWISEPEVVSFLRLSGNSKRVLRVYIGEVVGLIMDWGLEGFKEVEMVGLLDNIMCMTETARKRLLPLVY